MTIRLSTLSGADIQKLSHSFVSKIETARFAGEAIVPSKDDKNKMKINAIVQTESCFYIFEKEKESYRLESFYSLFDLDDIGVKRETLKIKFQNKAKKKKFHFELPDATKLLLIIIRLHKNLLWGLTSNQIPKNTKITSNSKYILVDIPDKKPENLLLNRYVGYCISKSIPIENEIISILIDYNKNPRRLLNLSNIDLKSVKPTMKSLLFERDLRNITLNNFGVHNFGNILNKILTMQNKIISIDYRNYENANFNGIEKKKSNLNKTETIRIHDCSSQFIFDFFNAFRGVYYKLNTLIFENICFDSNTAKIVVDYFQNQNFFSSITSLGFIGCTCTDVTFFEFISQSIQALEKLNNLYLENCNIDINDMLIEVANSNAPIQNICLRKNFANSLILHEQNALSQTLLSIDVGECIWTADSFISLISGICHRTRRLPLALCIDKAKIETSWFDIFDRLSSESLQPVLMEFNMCDVQFDENTFPLFLHFLETQSPITLNSQMSLQYLNISRCIPEKSYEQSLPLLLNFLSTRSLWGLEVAGIKPSIKYKDIPGLYSLNIGGNKIDNEVQEIIIEIIKQSRTLSELGVNDMIFDDINQGIKFYNSILSYPKIISIDIPRKFLEENSGYIEVQKIKKLLFHRRNYSSINQRLTLYLSLSGEFSIHVQAPISLYEFDDSTKEGSNISTILYESSFSNPIPSLFTLASINNVDASVHPIAAMVSEYVATSGRFGTIPPTAPPVEPASDKMELPSIFSTIENQNEIDSPYEYDFDVKSDEVTSFSKELANSLKSSIKVSLTGDNKFWGKRDNFVSFKTLDIK